MSDDITAPDPAAVTDPDAETIGRVAAILAEHRWRDTLSGDIARAILADLRERYILVPREGAEEARELASPSVTLSPEGYAEYAEDMGAEARPMPRSRAVVYGPWQSDAEAVPDLMAALHASVVRARDARAARNGEPAP